MKINELKDLLAEIAEKDLADKSDINDHPCSVAIRAIDSLVDDIETLKGIANPAGKSKRVQVLCRLNYSPTV